MRVRSRCFHVCRTIVGLLALAMIAAVALVSPAAAQTLFRPLTADPREPQVRWRMVEYTSDWRFGTDPTDSLTHGGWEEDRTGLLWEAGAGHTLRSKPGRKVLGYTMGRAHQYAVSGAIFAVFDNSSSLLNADYQFGAGIHSQWTGALPENIPAPPPPDDNPPWTTQWGGRRTPGYFDQPVITTRVDISHHSSHLGDEYVTESNFGRNQVGNPLAGALFDHPPVKRMDLSYENFSAVVSIESAIHGGASVWRGYGGIEARNLLPGRWSIGALRPKGLQSPVYRGGAEWSSSGNAPDPHDGWVTHLLRRFTQVESDWYAAADVRVARPFNFAGCDNPNGDEEVWTPQHWTACEYGHEFREYATTWHAMTGATIWPGVSGKSPTRLGGPTWLISLEWYRGYSSDGQFLDQRERWRPRYYVLPSVTVRF